MKTTLCVLLFSTIGVAGLSRPSLGDSPDATLPIKVRYFPSLLSGISDRRARAVTKPMLDLISRAIEYPLDYDIEDSLAADPAEPEALFAFAKKLDAGEVHLGAVWGVEYGWMRQRYPQLKAHSIFVYGDQGGVNSQIMVAGRFSGKTIDDLRGKILATCERVTLMDRLWVNKTLDRLGETSVSFFGEIKKFRSVREAVLAVNRGDADCVVLSALAYWGQVANQPKVTLRPLLVSSPFAVPVVVGHPSTLEQLRPGLWQRMQDELFEVHRTPVGKEGVSFWRQARFGKPDAAFDTLVEKNVMDYPISALRSLAVEPAAPK